jgi:hypothetical protein
MVEIYERDIQKISVYMIKDHQRILSLLHAFEMTFEKNPGDRLESLEKFEWHLQKHIFVEEKAVFSILNYKIELDEEYGLLLELSNQHLELLNEVSKIKKELLREERTDTNRLRELKMKHLKFEEHMAYPKLDELLDESEREKILNNIKDIL